LEVTVPEVVSMSEMIGKLTAADASRKPNAYAPDCSPGEYEKVAMS
jgi:hypothetical protein